MLEKMQPCPYPGFMEKDFGARLRAFREGRGLGLKELAHAAGRSESWLSRVETGESKDDPPYGVVLRLAKRLGIHPDELGLSESYAVIEKQVGQGRSLPNGTASPPARVRVNEGASSYDAEYDAETRRLEELAKGLHNVVELRNQTRVRSVVIAPAMVTIPVTNPLSASDATEHGSQVEEQIAVPADQVAGVRQPLAFRVVGNCLVMRGIVTGDHLIVDGANTEPRNGQIVAARVNGLETAKIFCRIDDETVELQPSLPDYPTITARRGHDELVIIGVFVGIVPTGRRD